MSNTKTTPAVGTTTKIKKQSLNVQLNELKKQLAEAVIANEKKERINALTVSINALQQQISKQKKTIEEKQQAKIEKQKKYENENCFFKIGSKIMRLNGYVFENAFVITNYTANGYIVVCSDALGKCFISIKTRIKEGKKENSGAYLAKNELLGKEKNTILMHLQEAFKEDFQTTLKHIQGCKTFKKECTNARCKRIVLDSVKFASMYTPKPKTEQKTEPKTEQKTDK